MRFKVIAVSVVAAVAVAVVGIAWAAGVFSTDEPETPAVAPPTGPVAGTLPEGVYRYRLTKQEVRALMPTIEPALLEDAVGTFTWTIRDGTISLHQTDCKCSFNRISAPFTATPKVITVRWPKQTPSGVEFCANDCVELVGWRFDGRALHFRPLAPARYDLIFWGANKPWVKID